LCYRARATIDLKSDLILVTVNSAMPIISDTMKAAPIVVAHTDDPQKGHTFPLMINVVEPRESPMILITFLNAGDPLYNFPINFNDFSLRFILFLPNYIMLPFKSEIINPILIFIFSEMFAAASPIISSWRITA
jgi:hypothetical protein